MVMIPVGNNTKHNFSLWVFLEVYIRLLISDMAVSYFNPNGKWLILLLFTLWSWRPFYLSLKSLYSSWKWEKHKTKSDALNGKKDIPKH